VTDDVPTAPEQNDSAADPKHWNQNRRHMSLLWVCRLGNNPEAERWFQRQAGPRVAALVLYPSESCTVPTEQRGGAILCGQATDLGCFLYSPVRSSATKSSPRQSFFVGVRRVSQIQQTHAQDNLVLPVCLRCRSAPMSLTCTEEEYPGYKRRMFECLVCGATMTQWAGVLLASD
jgi:hypothetical protein